jgi:hypothetical protein
MRSKGAKTEVGGSVERLEQMLDLTISKRKNYQGKGSGTPDERTILEMVDRRLARMMVRSAEIESKLEAVEANRKKHGKQVRQSGRGRRAEKSECEESGFDKQTLASLYSTVRSLADTVHQMREEQIVLNAQVEMMHRFVFSKKE